ncbi:MAG: type II toxin-antitoxin system HicB family antitoxin [Vulcanimicrobiota bacterium]
MARKITLVYHGESECWWAESPDLPRYTAAAPTLEELRKMIFTELSLFKGEEFEFFEVFEDRDQARTA